MKHFNVFIVALLTIITIVSCEQEETFLQERSEVASDTKSDDSAKVIAFNISNNLLIDNPCESQDKSDSFVIGQSKTYNFDSCFFNNQFDLSYVIQVGSAIPPRFDVVFCSKKNGRGKKTRFQTRDLNSGAVYSLFGRFQVRDFTAKSVKITRFQ